jgi:hypothetical protein
MNKSVWFAVLLLLVALPVAAEVERTTGMRDGKPYLEMSQSTVMTGTVIAIDKKTREVKLRNEAGDTLTVVAGSQVKNFSKIRVKDVVKLNIKEQATIEIATSPEMPDTTEVSVTSAQPGEEPHGTVKTRTRWTASIVAIDKATSTVTLKGQDDNTFTATAKHKDTLDKVKVGDLVEITYTQALAISLDKAPAKGDAPAKK